MTFEASPKSIYESGRSRLSKLAKIEEIYKYLYSLERYWSAECNGIISKRLGFNIRKKSNTAYDLLMSEN